jgi:hypothetical protein
MVVSVIVIHLVFLDAGLPALFDEHRCLLVMCRCAQMWGCQSSNRGKGERAPRLMEGFVASLVGEPGVAVGVEVLAEVGEVATRVAGISASQSGQRSSSSHPSPGVVKSGMNRHARPPNGR